MPTYHVIWEIDLDAADPVSASRKALAIHRNTASWATVFTVHDGAQAVTVDLDPNGLDPSGACVPQVTLTA